MIVVHFVAESFDPKQGGMEESALRVLQLLNEIEGVRAIPYVTGVGQDVRPSGSDLVDVGSQVAALTTAFGDTESREKRREWARLKVVLLRNAVRD